jgi:hypothetical protein
VSSTPGPWGPAQKPIIPSKKPLSHHPPEGRTGIKKRYDPKVRVLRYQLINFKFLEIFWFSGILADTHDWSSL